MNKSNKEKDAYRDLADKKRRKSSATSAHDGAGAVSITKTSKEDVYSNVIKFEEQEAKHRTANSDSDLFHETCSELRNVFADIAGLKAANTDKTKHELAEKRIDCSYLFVVLKKLNRLDKIRMRSGRDALHKEKLSVDSNRLQLQNLLYEAEHLRKEVQRCFQFKSQDEEIELVGEDEFYARAPIEISRRDKTEGDLHARRLAQLEWELQQRKELSVLCKELQKQKEKVAENIEKQTSRLDSLAPRLDALLKSTRPLQEALDMNIEEDWKVAKIARLLPRPLYLAYANITAFSEACDNFLSTSIIGDEYEANQLEVAAADKYAKDECAPNSQESDNEDNDPESERSSKSHHHRRQSKSTIKEMKKENLFNVHPLSVEFKVKTANSTACLCVTLRYLPALDFVTARCTLDFGTTDIVTDTEVISPLSILTGLTAGDYGDGSMNPKTKYQLRELSVNPQEFLELLAEKQLGKPYKWAQQLCGLEFGTTLPNASVSHDLAQDSVPQIVKLIRARWQSRLTLYAQIKALENKKFQPKSSAVPIAKTPAVTASSLIQWSAISYTEYAAGTASQPFVVEGIASAHDLMYRAVILRGTAKLDCLVCISSNFPTELPVWALELSWNGKRLTAQSNSTMREMECWINTIAVPKKATNVLELQLNRALSCLDIFLETETTATGEPHFSRERTFLKAFRSRTRSRPFKVIENSGSVVYTQI